MTSTRNAPDDLTMALVACPECGRSCSDRAPQCPQCGHPLIIELPRKEPALAQAPTKKSGGRSGGISLIVLLGVFVGGYFLYQWYAAEQRGNRDYSPTSTSFSPASSGKDNAGARAGQTVVDEFTTLPEGGSYTYKIPAGHYRIRVTSNSKGIKARWVGVACYSSPSEQKVYEATCDPAASVQFIVENPTTLGLGPKEQVSINIVTR